MATSMVPYIPASAAVFPSSAAPAATWRAGSNFPSFVLAYDGNDGSADETAWFVMTVPDTYGGGNIYFRIYWEPAAASPAAENCSWDVLILGRADDEAFDAAASETITVNDAVTAAADLQVASTAASTPTIAAGDLLIIGIRRDYDEANGVTALGEDALLHGFQIMES